jgi:tetratricopeptide (TPR) repeat protein
MGIMLDLDNKFARAVAVHQSGDFAAAERMYRDLLRSYPAHAPSLCNLGVLLVRSGRVDEAAECYNLALAASPGHPDAHFNLGNLYRRVNRPREAAGHYRACLAANPTTPGPRSTSGWPCQASATRPRRPRASPPSPGWSRPTPTPTAGSATP